jgi:hypothetical protein
MRKDNSEAQDRAHFQEGVRGKPEDLLLRVLRKAQGNWHSGIKKKDQAGRMEEGPAGKAVFPLSLKSFLNFLFCAVDSHRQGRGRPEALWG